MWKRTPFKELLGILVVGGFITLLALGLNYLQKPNALENIEQRLDEAEQSQSVLTENEQKLKTEAQTKEWEEVDEKQIVPLPKPK
jgi:ActR/RegA family two-component response regulator